MRITIDSSILKKKGIQKDVFFHLLSLYFNIDTSEKPAKEANKSGLNIKDIGRYLLNRKGIELVEQVIAESSLQSDNPDDYYSDIAKAMMEYYPEGLKPGTNSWWRGSVKQIVERLKFLEFYSGCSITLEAAKKATEEYVNSFGHDRTYMQTLPYFIYKCKQNIEGEIDWSSGLLSGIEGLEDKDSR